MAEHLLALSLPTTSVALPTIRRSGSPAVLAQTHRIAGTLRKAPTGSWATGAAHVPVDGRRQGPGGGRPVGHTQHRSVLDLHESPRSERCRAVLAGLVRWGRLSP